MTQFCFWRKVGITYRAGFASQREIFLRAFHGIFAACVSHLQGFWMGLLNTAKGEEILWIFQGVWGNLG